MTDNLVKRLRAEHNCLMFELFGTDHPDDMIYDGDMPIRRIKDTSSVLKKAAARIEELEAEVARLRKENERLGADPLLLLESLIREATQPQKRATDDR